MKPKDYIKGYLTILLDIKRILEQPIVEINAIGYTGRAEPLNKDLKSKFLNVIQKEIEKYGN